MHILDSAKRQTFHAVKGGINFIHSHSTPTKEQPNSFPPMRSVRQPEETFRSIQIINYEGMVAIFSLISIALSVSYGQTRHHDAQMKMKMKMKYCGEEEKTVTGSTSTCINHSWQLHYNS